MAIQNLPAPNQANPNQAEPEAYSKAHTMERLKRRTDFRAAAQAGARAPANAFVLQARRRDETGQDNGPARFGFTVSKQVGNAVERNRVRRRLREMVRLKPETSFSPGHDYVLIGRRTALALPFSDMARELDGALRRVATGAGNKPPLHKAGSSGRPAPRPQRQRTPKTPKEH
ncbi:MAG TPA: ribonuclease P protein component [Xanthobacteraceae bacterium]|jgi:ribonuclease P protein component|nr:ribonuclease P protein component [Xanthobacteraceae bacterium]